MLFYGIATDSSFDTSNTVMALPTLVNGEKIEDVSAVNQQDQYSLNAVANEIQYFYIG